MKNSADNTIQHVYKQSHDGDGLLYAWFPSMHTRVDIVFYDRKSEEDLLLVVSRVYDTLCQLEETANYYAPSSELARVNRVASVTPITISRELYTMIALCLEYHEKTLGCFDVTIHSDNYNQDTIRSVVLKSDEPSLFFRQPGVTINLSGFLKGYALDKIKGILESHKIENALINMGNSSVLALGNHPNGTGWKVSFGNSMNVPGNNESPGILLQNEFLTTSGNDSKERKHIISPQSGKLVEGARQVAVVTDNGTVGEILSTSLFVANSEQRETLITEFHPKRSCELLA